MNLFKSFWVVCIVQNIKEKRTGALRVGIFRGHGVLIVGSFSWERGIPSVEEK